MRVLFVESGNVLSGAQQALLNLLKHLDRAAIHPIVASLNFGEGNVPELIEALDIPVHRLPAGRFRHFRASADKIRELARLIAAERIDLVFSNSGHPNLFARPASWLTRRPNVWWVHGYDPGDFLQARPIALVQQALAADRLIANSNHTAKMLRDGFGERHPIGVVFPGINIDEFFPSPAEGRRARQSLCIAPNEFVVGVFGRLQSWKGQHVVIRAIAELLRRGRPVRLLIAGSALYGIEPEYECELRQLVSQLNADSSVLFLGTRPDVRALMNACDVIVHSSLKPEPFGLVVAEAMATEKPVIASGEGGPIEMIDSGRSGFLIEAGNSTLLASALDFLRSSPQVRQTVARAARSAALRFAAAVTAQQMTEQLYLAREAHA